MSPAGIQLNNLTGVAAMLHMAFPDLDDLVGESDDGDLDSEEDGEVGASQAGSHLSDTQSMGASSTPGLSAAHETGSIGGDDDGEDSKVDGDGDSTTMQDHEEWDIDHMIEGLEDDDIDFM
jgi:hypothetical protein